MSLSKYSSEKLIASLMSEIETAREVDSDAHVSGLLRRTDV